MEAALKDKADETMDANAAAVDMAALIAASASPNGPSSGVCVVCTAAFCNEDFKSKYCNWVGLSSIYFHVIISFDGFLFLLDTL